MDENLENLLDEMIGERINFHSANSPDEQDSDGLAELDTAYKTLYASLNPEQKKLAISVENGFSLLRSSIENFYFRAGVKDGIAIVMGLLGR